MTYNKSGGIMSTIPDLFNTSIIDNQTGRQFSAKSLAETGDWQFLQLGHYTTGSPWVVNEGVTDKLTFQEVDITYSAGNGLEINYDYAAQLFLPRQLGDLFLTEIRFKAKCSAQNGYADLLVTSPSFLYNPVTGSTFSVPKGAGVEQFITVNGSIFVGDEVRTNGFEVKIQAGSGNFSIYDVSILSCRLGGDKS
ncbi:hypothetical protein S140_124 [Shewanella sp. phage 1/40]|uniref:hypothetical protein n=1 Tax=Shewanella sp. phage 1/40 TaxID=1458860 RepID=UPI0004F5E8F6|nr:hypothetical protein S140_124 [Shewanella sp. phage 1/40]AHK11531.1 hypothetical protein S140_124 [Shewanella sp. phage 1/40]